jgi:hypothetical protein
VDWVQATRKIQRSKSSRVYPRHHASLRNTQPRHHRFGFPFYSYQIQKLGTKLWHQYKLYVSCTPWGWRTSRKSQWAYTSWIKTKIIWRTRRLRLQMDWGITQSSMGALHSSKQSNWILTFFSSIWIRSHATSRFDLDIPKNRAIRGGRSRTHMKIRTWQNKRGQDKCYPSVSSIPL